MAQALWDVGSKTAPSAKIYSRYQIMGPLIMRALEDCHKLASRSLNGIFSTKATQVGNFTHSSGKFSSVCKIHICFKFFSLDASICLCSAAIQRATQVISLSHLFTVCPYASVRSWWPGSTGLRKQIGRVKIISLTWQETE